MTKTINIPTGAEVRVEPASILLGSGASGHGEHEAARLVLLQVSWPGGSVQLLVAVARYQGEVEQDFCPAIGGVWEVIKSAKHGFSVKLTPVEMGRLDLLDVPAIREIAERIID